MTKHRNLKYDESFEPRGTSSICSQATAATCRISGRTGCAPPVVLDLDGDHLEDARSASPATTCTSSIRCCAASACRSSRPAGRLRDALKLAFYRTVTSAMKPLRALKAMRRVLRRIALGKRANYYLKDA